MKIIFLDVDGVLNTRETFKIIHKEWKETGIRRVEIDDIMLGNLKKLVDETGSKIVLTSSWKDYLNDNIEPISEDGKAFLEKFKEYGLYIYAKLKRSSEYRGDEIKKYLLNNNIESFVILDDDLFNYEKLGLIPYLVQTSFEKDGFGEEGRYIAMKILKRNKT